VKRRPSSLRYRRFRVAWHGIFFLLWTTLILQTSVVSIRALGVLIIADALARHGERGEMHVWEDIDRVAAVGQVPILLLNFTYALFGLGMALWPADFIALLGLEE
jgi:hypothetical protein